MDALKSGYALHMEGNLIFGSVHKIDLPGLTPQMLACLKIIHGYVEANSISPSYEEIRSALGLANKSQVHRIAKQLVSRGYLVEQPYCARSLRLTAEARDALAE